MDVKVTDTGSGGDLFYEAGDILTIEGLQNQVYLALFGGNPGFSTPFERLETEQAFDFWGNSILNEGQRFNSRTQHAINNNALSSSGRSEIEKAVKKDLEYMREFANIEAEVTIDSDSRISILVTVLEPENIEDKEFRFIWDATKEELTIE